MRELKGEIAVVRDQQQPVESPSRRPTGNSRSSRRNAGGHEIEYVAPAFRIAGRRDHAFGLVDQHVRERIAALRRTLGRRRDGFGHRQLDDFTVEFHDIVRRIDEARQRRDDAAVHPHAAGGDHFFAIAPRADAGVGHGFLEANAGRSGSGLCGVDFIDAPCRGVRSLTVVSVWTSNADRGVERSERARAARRESRTQRPCRYACAPAARAARCALQIRD